MTTRLSVAIARTCHELLEEQRLAANLRVAAEAYLTLTYGRRCEDFDPNCFCCQKWKTLDDLMDLHPKLD